VVVYNRVSPRGLHLYQEIRGEKCTFVSKTNVERRYPFFGGNGDKEKNSEATELQ
jgi:hypothetical protein